MKTLSSIIPQLTVALLLAMLGSWPAQAAYYPAAGDLYYDGAFYLDSYFAWGATPGPFSVSDPGYEHDLWVHNNQFFNSTCTAFTNMPDGYDDCPTAGVGDPNGPVFSFGTFDATALSGSSAYFGGWNFSTHMVAAPTSPFNLQGQENENRCFGLPTIWCMFSTQTRDLITGWYMNWGGTPSYILF